MFSLLRTDGARRQMSLAKPPPCQTQFTYETSVEHDQYDKRTEEYEETVEHVLVDNVVDEVALEVRLDGARWLH